MDGGQALGLSSCGGQEDGGERTQEAEEERPGGWEGHRREATQKPGAERGRTV